MPIATTSSLPAASARIAADILARVCDCLWPVKAAPSFCVTFAKVVSIPMAGHSWSSRPDDHTTAPQFELSRHCSVCIVNFFHRLHACLSFELFEDSCASGVSGGYQVLFVLSDWFFWLEVILFGCLACVCVVFLWCMWSVECVGGKGSPSRLPRPGLQL